MLEPAVAHSTVMVYQGADQTTDMVMVTTDTEDTMDITDTDMMIATTIKGQIKFYKN